MCKGWGLNGGEPRLQAAAAVIVPPASAVPGLFLEMRPCSGMIWRPELGGGPRATRQTQRATGTGAAAIELRVGRKPGARTASIRFCCVWKSFRCSDPKLWPPMRNGLQGCQRSGLIAHGQGLPLVSAGYVCMRPTPGVVAAWTLCAWPL